MNKIILAFALLIITSCGNGSTGAAGRGKAAESDAVHAGANPVTGFAEGAPFVLAGCYEMILKRDTARLTLQVTDTIVTGKLAYHWYEQDANAGTIKGVLRDSLIVAYYTFQSEGLTSVREVVWKINDTTLVQAYGELKNENNKVVFENKNSLRYLNESPFIKVNCAP